MARLEFDADEERGNAFVRIGNKNRVGRKHNHQPRGRALERKRQNMIKGAAIKAALAKKKWDRFHALVAAYWRGEIDDFPKPPTA